MQRVPIIQRRLSQRGRLSFPTVEELPSSGTPNPTLPLISFVPLREPRREFEASSLLTEIGEQLKKGDFLTDL